MKKTIHFRVITPETFSNIDFVSDDGERRRLISTIEEAYAEIERFGSISPDSEYYEKWQERKRECKIVKVTIIVEDIDEMDGIYKFKGDIGDHRNAKYNSRVLVNAINSVTEKD